MNFKKVSFFSAPLAYLRFWFRSLFNESGALTFTKIQNVITQRMGGVKMRVYDITLDASYVIVTGYVITPANVGLRTKILELKPANVLGFMASTTYSGVNAILRWWKGSASASTILIECATNEAGLSGLVCRVTALGY